jgi:hypothetical protein
MFAFIIKTRYPPTSVRLKIFAFTGFLPGKAYFIVWDNM